MKPVFIYALLDPTEVVRYLGQTDKPDRRLSAHLRPVEKSTPCSCWIKKLLSKNLRPIMEIIDVVPDTEADFWEREYIQNFRERGFDLLNIAPGGSMGRGENNPNFGKKFSLETRAKMSAARMGMKFTKAHCANLSAANLGKKLSLATCAKMSAANLGKKLTPEHCTKIGNAKLGRKLKNNTSGFVGAYWHSGTRKWRAKVGIGGKDIHVGLFKKIEDAVFARALAIAIQ